MFFQHFVEFISNTMKAINKRDITELSRMKIIATSLLGVFLVIFFVASYFEQRHAIFGYIKAFAEASLVGGLADWFAVAALFRHPLGLPVPHTNLIEKKKETIAKSVAGFIYDNFLSKEKLEAKLRSASQKITEYIKKSGKSDVFEKLMKYYPKKIEINDTDIKPVITEQADAFFKSIDFSELSSKMLDVLAKNREHQQLLNEALKQAGEILSNPDITDFVAHKIDKKAKWYAVGIETYTKNFFKFINELLESIQQNPEHEIRRKLDEKIKIYIVDLAHKKYKEKFDRIKNGILESSSYHDFVENLWTTIRKKLAQSFSSDKDHKQLTENLSKFITEQLYDEYVNFVFESWIVENLTKLIENQRDDIEEYIKQTVMDWPNASIMIERYLGKDLQYIRINGSLVGGIIGLLIYVIA